MTFELLLLRGVLLIPPLSLTLHANPSPRTPHSRSPIVSTIACTLLILEKLINMVVSSEKTSSVAARPNGKRPIDNSETPQTKKPKLPERTDHAKWRMLDERGRQTWHYLEDDDEAKEWPQSKADKYFLGLPLVCKLSS